MVFIKYLVFCLFLHILMGCQLGYLAKSSYGQLHLLSQREDIEKVIAQTQDQTLKEKLILSQNVKNFAEKKLGLAHTKNYTQFVQLKNPYVTYVVSASERFKWKSYEWWFPIVGHVPYKGFFDPADAKKEAAELKSQDLDVYLRGVSAYSTLGWFNDPLLSSMTQSKPHNLVNTLIHETVHATIYIKSESSFNERLASFLGDKGTEDYYLEIEGADSPTLKQIQNENLDTLLFSKFISEEVKSLKTWYETESNITEESRSLRFKEIQSRFSKVILPELLTPDYKNFGNRELNNAYLMQFDLYYGNFDDFEKVYHHFKKEFRPTLDFFKGLEKEKNPSAFLSQFANSLSN